MATTSRSGNFSSVMVSTTSPSATTGVETATQTQSTGRSFTTTGTTRTPETTATATAVTPATSPMSTTTQVYYDVTKSTDEIKVDVPFSIKFEDTTFNATLLDVTSTYFTQTAKDYEKKLTEAFRSTIGFQSVEVTKFWSGSLGVDYKVTYNHTAVSKPSVLQDQLTTTVRDHLHSLTGVSQDYLNQTFQSHVASAVETMQLVEKNPCDARAGLCSNLPFYTCEVDNSKGSSGGQGVLCVSPCTGHSCGPYGGTCFLDSTGHPKCRCPRDKKYVYGGERCEERAEKQDTSSDTMVVVVAAVAGGSLLLILVTVIVAVVCYKRQSRRSMKQKASGESQRSSLQPGMGIFGTSTSRYFFRDQPGAAIFHLTSEDKGFSSGTGLGHGRARTEPSDPHDSGYWRPSLPRASLVEPDDVVTRQHGYTGSAADINARHLHDSESTRREYMKERPVSVYTNMPQEQITIQRPHVSADPAEIYQP